MGFCPPFGDFSKKESYAMEKQPKRRIPVTVAGNSLSLMTDEPEEFVRQIVTSLNRRFAEVGRSHFRASDLDVALLCAIDYMGDAIKAEARLREAEEELTQLRAEIAKLRAEAEEKSAAATEEKIRAFEDYVATKKAAATPATGDISPEERRERDEKIAAIEALLRGNEKN